MTSLYDLESYIALLEEIAEHGRMVIGALEIHGSSIVPHLLDTDDNAGERLRKALERLDKWEEIRVQVK